MSINVLNLSKNYGEQKALDNVSFSIKSGEIVGFLGPNGAGKSTMMKILCSYLPPNSGKAEVCGLDVDENSIEVRSKIGYLPEHNPLYLEMYIKEYLAFVAGVHKVDLSRVSEMIEAVGLTKEQNKKIEQLSKGYRQRVGLAAALIHDPEVLILDEPTTGLDPNQLVEIRNLIQNIGKHKTVMLSTHIMQEVELLCSRVIIINDGKIIADRPIQTLQDEQSSMIFDFELDVEVSISDLKAIPGINHVEPVNSENKRWLISTDSNEDIRKTIFKHAVKKDWVVLEFKQRKEKLEQIFQNLTDTKK